MTSRRFSPALLAAGLAMALAAAPTLAQTGGGATAAAPAAATSHEADRLAREFTALAGSPANAQALVAALRDGSTISLADTAPGATGTATFPPDTGKMGYGDVKIALSLAEASLAKAGITAPTATELEAALNGGRLVMADGSAVDLKGVLAARADGAGWGRIAADMGLKLGDVVRSPKHAGEVAEHGHHAHDKVARVELAHGHDHDAASHAARPEHVGKVDRPQRPDRPERPERPDRPDHPDHAGRPGG
ncbi:hypothetical protein [Rhodanobacter sp. PCA2]|uniref:hypothetical protein n=1 Tax=Rhodanobacter sp. PCA2 TaxID=2006117 RepID=UPI0015E6CC15|nr:hypothetical protein [Rhodanobacter sp. PCA2]MBA2079900.1 hypothetical protein [Rhodanobacter sp. PCA2]